MGIRQTHTYAVLELTKAAYDEIASKLRDAGYTHAFGENGVIDMQGIGVALYEGEHGWTGDERGS